MRELPPPTPGGVNRTDPDPEGDAIRALGGNPERAARASGDVITYASRFGVSPDIRGTLAAEDLEFRRRNDGRLLSGLLNNTNVLLPRRTRHFICDEDRLSVFQSWKRCSAAPASALPSPLPPQEAFDVTAHGRRQAGI